MSLLLLMIYRSLTGANDSPPVVSSEANAIIIRTRIKDYEFINRYVLGEPVNFKGRVEKFENTGFDKQFGSLQTTLVYEHKKDPIKVHVDPKTNSIPPIRLKWNSNFFKLVVIDPKIQQHLLQANFPAGSEIALRGRKIIKLINKISGASSVGGGSVQIDNWVLVEALE